MLTLIALAYLAVGGRFAYVSWRSGFPFSVIEHDYAHEMNAAAWVVAWPVLYFVAR